MTQLSLYPERLGQPDQGSRGSSTHSSRRDVQLNKCPRRAPIEAGRGLNASMLAKLQQRVADLELHRGTTGESLQQKGLILTEEAFEVLKALRKLSGVATDTSWNSSLADELADVLFVSAAMANRLPTDLGASWGSECLGTRSKTGTEPGPDAVLMASLELAQQVLTVVSKLASATLTRDAALSADDTELFVSNLESLLVSIDDVASVAHINLQNALDQKLNRDQLRLWT